jgi:uncharacterized protein
MRKIRIILLVAVLFAIGGCAAIQRKFLFFPTHHDRTNGLVPWQVNGQTIGYVRPVSAPNNVWLMLHGNGGQATDRIYALNCFSPRDAVFILEYPGYGARPGRPSKASLDAAAEVAYAALRASFPNTPVCLVGESIGSGPTSALARQSRPPDKIVLVVPFDNLAAVAHHHMPFLPVRAILGETWDNVKSLSGYRGPVEIFGAKEDTVIPLIHARNLAESVQSSKFVVLDGGHNDWSNSNAVAFRNP